MSDTKRRIKNQREQLASLSRAWVEEQCLNRLTSRDVRVLKFIHEVRLALRWHVEELFFKYQSDGSEIKDSSGICNNRLRVMYDKHCVNKFFPHVPLGAGTPQSHICLDRAGALLLKMMDEDNYSKWNYYQELPSNYKHTLLETDLYTLFHIRARDNKGEIRYLKLDKPFTFTTYTGEKQNISPDVFIDYKEKENLLCCFEVDTGSELIKTLLNKIVAYDYLANSGEWKDKKWGQARCFPKIAFILNNERRLEKLVKAVPKFIAKEIPDTALTILFSTHEKVMNNLFGNIWIDTNENYKFLMSPEAQNKVVPKNQNALDWSQFLKK